jgi:hypothetical protein
MPMSVKSILAGLIALIAMQSAAPAPGAGNNAAAEIARKSQLVKTAADFLVNQAKSLQNARLRQETLDAIANPSTCVRHRAGLTDPVKNRILQTLIREGLLLESDASAFPGGGMAGVFPAVPSESTDCPRLPQPFIAAPGSAFHSHHSYPGGLVLHEANNEVANLHLEEQYRQVYDLGTKSELPAVRAGVAKDIPKSTDTGIHHDLIVGPPIWHDWAKTIVFQWNADGSEFPELNFGGNGTTDDYGQPGDSRTGAHHIIGLAEAIKRGLDPEFVITQAAAHAAPTSGEYKIVNWIRAAAIIAQVDPVAQGYLANSGGKLRLPAFRKSGERNTAERQPNVLIEYELHNLSDADFTFSGPAISIVEPLLAELASEFGFNAGDVATYNLRYRNPALSCLSAERLQVIYANQGLNGVRQQLQMLRRARVF